MKKIKMMMFAVAMYLLYMSCGSDQEESTKPTTLHDAAVYLQQVACERSTECGLSFCVITVNENDFDGTTSISDLNTCATAFTDRSDNCYGVKSMAQEGYGCVGVCNNISGIYCGP